MSELDGRRLVHIRALHEFARLSNLTDNPDVKHWLGKAAMGQLLAAGTSESDSGTSIEELARSIAEIRGGDLEDHPDYRYLAQRLVLLGWTKP